MFPIVTSLLLALSFATLSHARTYVDTLSGYIATTYSTGGGGYTESGPATTEAECVTLADARADCIGYVWVNSGCFTFNAYPTICSGNTDYGTGWVQAFVDRCTTQTGYKIAPDSTCIYTGGADLTLATYQGSCSSANTANPVASPAPYRRAARQQNPFIGGKVCPIGEQACPLGNGLACLNVRENLNSCGGCIGGAGVDCSDIIGASNVACEFGECIVSSCSRGYTLSPEGQCLK